MRWALAAAMAALTLAGCAPQAPPPSDTGTPPTLSMESAGKWQGEAGDLRLTLDLKPSSEVEWKEETAGGSKTWTGKWRDEGDELYLLLSKPTSRNALFKKKDDTWIEDTIDGEEAMKGAEIVLRRP